MLVGCAATPVDGGESADDFDFDASDTGDGKSDGAFNQNNILSDELFTADAMAVSDVQLFFEDSPYHNRSWLADFSVDGVSAAQLIVDAAQAAQVNPLVLIARIQVESSAVSKTAKPSQFRIDRIMGCGCSDGASCTSFKGFEAQLTCGANTMRRWFDGSVDGTGQWQLGVSRKTLDPRTVTPANHATASLYAYTPWVLVGTGGNWLVWNVTRKYVRHAEAVGLVH
jgi:hypothetical protein